MSDSTLWSWGLWIMIFLVAAIVSILVTDHIDKRALRDEFDDYSN